VRSTRQNDPADARRLFRAFGSTTLAEPNPPSWSYPWLETHPTHRPADRDGERLRRQVSVRALNSNVVPDDVPHLWFVTELVTMYECERSVPAAVCGQAVTKA